MARRKKRKIVENVSISGMADKGKGVGRDEEGMVYFVEAAVPGDVVDVLVKKKKGSYKIGSVAEFKKYSELRVEAFCQHFGQCGGCKWQNLAYPSQLEYKEKAILDAFKRIGHVEIKETRPIIGCEQIQLYRNKLEYSFCDRRWVPQEELDTGKEVNFGPASGFHRAGAFNKIVQIEKCHLQEDLSNQIRNRIHALALEHNWSFHNPKEHKGMLRNIFVRNTTLGEWMIIMVFGEDDEALRKLLLEDLKSNFPALSSMYYVVNTKMNDSVMDLSFVHYAGTEKITEELGHIKYKIGPKSFFQTNTKQAKVLYDEVVKLADLQGQEVVYDLYTGLGSIALYVAKNCQKVIGIEEIEQAIDDAILNKEFNGIENAQFEVGDCKEAFNADFVAKHGAADVIIVDPPRAGLHADVVSMLLSTDAKKIVYVSCNPSTQARDIALLNQKYMVELIQPVDMFPHTHHIENIALLIKKEG